MVGSGGSDAVYSFSDQAIESVDVVKDLGVLVDSKFCLLYTSPSPRD